MTGFWIVTTTLSAVVALVLGVALLRGRRDTGPAEAFDLKVYEDQLKEIDRDAARGVVAPEEADRLRVEVSRRILAADSKTGGRDKSAAQPRVLGFVAVGLMAAAVLGGGYGVYTQIGAPGFPDLPLEQRIAEAREARDNRPSQAEVEATLPPAPNPEVTQEYRDLVQRLRGAVAENPDDLRGQQLLARSEAALGNFSAAWQAQERIVTLLGARATGKDYADLADMLILAAGGYVSPEAQGALEHALSLDPQNGVARYYAGLMLAQTGRPDLSFRMWDRLLRDSPRDAPWIPPLLEQIEEMAYRAGVSDYQIPAAAPALPGPSQEDMDAAGEMTAEDRQAMIEGMVAQLGERLATEGGAPEEWARLINALGVLGRTDRAALIWVEAQTVFAENPVALDTIRGAAQQAGVAGVDP